MLYLFFIIISVFTLLNTDNNLSKAIAAMVIILLSILGIK